MKFSKFSWRKILMRIFIERNFKVIFLLKKTILTDILFEKYLLII